jgi:hypothetical protein
MATSMKDLEALHKLITKSYTDRIQQDLDDNIPTDAATLSGAVKFLKDNAVTADPASTDDLSDLRDKLKEAAETRRKKVGSVMSLVESDMKAMEA